MTHHEKILDNFQMTQLIRIKKLYIYGSEMKPQREIGNYFELNDNENTYQNLQQIAKVISRMNL